MYLSKGRSGTHQNHISNHPDDWDGLSNNGRQFRSSITRQINDLQGSDYWQLRKQLPTKLSICEDIRWDSYRTPSYYHQPKQAKAVPIVEEQSENLSSVNIPTQEKKESIFLTLKEGNVFRKMYEKFVK